ncbi:MAG: RsmE family RNA methyltransferase [Treponematales bacterium]
MNIILFEPREIGRPLARRDCRTVHLLKTLRKKTGDTFDAGLLGGDRGKGTITAVRLDGSLLCALDLTEPPPARCPVRMAVGFARPIQLKRILRDLSSLGVEAVDIVATELGEKSYQETKLLSDGGALASLIEGAAQARDTRVPALTVYGSLGEWLVERPWDTRNERADTAVSLPWNVYAAETRHSPKSPLLIAADNVRPAGSFSRLSALGQSLVVAVGSERGWSEAERQALEGAGFQRLSLGGRALRTETACVAAAILGLEKIGALDE